MAFIKIVNKHPDQEEVARRMFWLAYQAAGEPAGMGVFQDRGRVNEEDVWNNICTKGDYPGTYTPPVKDGVTAFTADYVFGRRMKLRIKAGPDYIEVSDAPLTNDNPWRTPYKTTVELYEAAVTSLEAEEAIEKEVKQANEGMKLNPEAKKHVDRLREIAMKGQEVEELPHCQKLAMLTLSSIAEMVISDDLPEPEVNMNRLRIAGDMIAQMLCDWDL